MADSASVERARLDLERIDRQIARLVDAVANGADAKALNSKIKELEAARPGAEATLAGATASGPLLHPNLARIYRDKIERLTEAVSGPNREHEAFEIIRGLIREVRLVPVDGLLAIELAGDLAGILALSEAGKSGTSSVSKALQIKMVAGARSHLYRTELRI